MDRKLGNFRQCVAEQESPERMAEQGDWSPLPREVPEPDDESLADLLVGFGEGKVGEVLRRMSRAPERPSEPREAGGSATEAMDQEGTHVGKILRRAAGYLVVLNRTFCDTSMSTGCPLTVPGR